MIEESRSARPRPGLQRMRHALGHTGKAIALLWQTDSQFATALVGLSLLTGILPAALIYTGKLVVDSLVTAAQDPSPAKEQDLFVLLAVAFGLSVLLAAAQRIVGVLDALLRLRIAQKVKEKILQKSIELELSDFEQSTLYDQLTQAREQASERPLSLVRRGLGAIQQSAALFAYLALLVTFSAWLVVVIAVLTGLGVWVEARHNILAFQLFRARSPDARRQQYLELMLTRDDHAKEVKHLNLGPVFLKRHQAIFREAYAAESALTLRRGWTGFCVGLAASIVAGVGFVWVTWAALASTISLGTAAMLLLAVRQAQTAGTDLVLVAAGMHEDHLYFTTLATLLSHPVQSHGTARSGPLPGDGIRCEDVWFSYPGTSEPVLRAVSFHAAPGQILAIVGANAAGKSTLIKLLTGLYAPSRGRILLDGRDFREWDPSALRQRISPVFQDFVRYQLLAGENIGAGDAQFMSDSARWASAARSAGADLVVAHLPQSYHTQLGHWFSDGEELSQGEWQKLALSRMFMRSNADVLVLDEPTHSLDAHSEVALLRELQKVTTDRIAFLVTHRSSTLEFSTSILVLDRGSIVEMGSPGQLRLSGGALTRLFARSETPVAPAESPAMEPEETGSGRRPKPADRHSRKPGA